MAVCTSCQNYYIVWLGATKSSGPQICSSCNTRFLGLQQYTATTIEQAFARGGVSYEMEQAICTRFNVERMPKEFGVPVINRLVYLRRVTEVNAAISYLEAEFKKGGVSVQVGQEIHARLNKFQVPEEFQRPVLDRLARLRTQTEVNAAISYLEAEFKKGGVSVQVGQEIHARLNKFQVPEKSQRPVRDRLARLRTQTEVNAAIAILNTAFENEEDFTQAVQNFWGHLHAHSVPEDLKKPAIDRLAYLRRLLEIRTGKLPVVDVDIHLDSDEYAHFECWAIYIKPTKSMKFVDGTLIGTNKKCYFIADNGPGSMTMDWNNVVEVFQDEVDVDGLDVPINGKHLTVSGPVPALSIRVSRGTGGGDYLVEDPLYLKTMMDTLVRLWKRQLVIYRENKDYGPVPDHVKAAVFQRDGGKCAQCGYEGEYIEYDHRIPRSKGGINTVDNIQLLCRKCNLKKSNRL
ncbi:HNH endonuclease [Ktedonobacteria bacterium brp13]|nr:HNH endonuclease [Ktedonobacteria bacterium brp13]